MEIHRITPTRPISDHLRSLWRARTLVAFFMWRDWRVRYRQTLVGATWAVLQPVILVGIFSLALSRIVPTGGSTVSYPVFVFTGMVPWLLFAQGTAQASNSLVAHAELIRKAAFARLTLPIAAVGGFLPDYLVGTLVAVVIMTFQSSLSAAVALVSVAALLTSLAGIAVGTGLAALNVRYRDVRFATPFLLQAWLFATPVVYPPSLLEDSAPWLLSLNPMNGPVQLFRWSLGVIDGIPWTAVGSSCLISTLVLSISLSYFVHSEDRMADVV